MERQSQMFYSIRGTDMNSSNSYNMQKHDLAVARKLTKITGCLEILDGQDCGILKAGPQCPSNSRPSSDTASRSWSRCSMGSVPPRSDSSMSRHLNTPTKQISLQAVPRKENSDTEIFGHQDGRQSFGLKTENRQIWHLEADAANEEFQVGLRLESVTEEATQHDTKPLKPEAGDSSKKITFPDGDVVRTVTGKELNGDNKNPDDDDNGEDDTDDSSDSSDEEEEDKLRAPNELLMEFVDSLMRKNYQTAQKLCQMILLYEPDNSEALKFQPLIAEKIALDTEAEKEAAEESNDDNDESEGEDDDEEEDSSDEDDDSSSEDESSEEDDDDEEEEVTIT